MKQIKISNPLTQIEGHVEYTSYFIDVFGHHEEEGRTTEKFTNLRQLFKLFSRENIEKWQGMGEGGNKTTVRIGDKMDGWVSTNVTVDDVDSIMLRCVNDVESKLKEALNSIYTYKNHNEK
jgi:hypothetical protein